MRPNQAVSARACPICKTGLSLSNRHGVQIDYCHTCRGVWLDRGELDRIMERNSAEAEPQGQAPEKGGYRESPLHDDDDDDDDDFRPRYGKPNKSAQRVVLAHLTDSTRPRDRTGMPTRDDKAYFSARAAEERERHADANDPAAAIVHAQLAQRYAVLAARDVEPYALHLVQEDADEERLRPISIADPRSLLGLSGASAKMRDFGKEPVR